MVTIPTKTLNSGYTIPVLGLGTWLSQAGEVGKAVEYAIKNGYRHIDCAYAYLNQKEVGEALSRVFAEKIVQVSAVFGFWKIASSKIFVNPRKSLVSLSYAIPVSFFFWLERCCLASNA